MGCYLRDEGRELQRNQRSLREKSIVSKKNNNKKWNDKVSEIVSAQVKKKSTIYPGENELMLFFKLMLIRELLHHSTAFTCSSFSPALQLLLFCSIIAFPSGSLFPQFTIITSLCCHPPVSCKP